MNSAIRRLREQGYVSTFVAQFFILVGGLLTLTLAATLLGSAGFGEYAVARRMLSILTFPLLLGLGISIPRYVALSGTGESGAAHRSAYFLGGLIVAAPMLVLFCAVVLPFRSFFAQLFFGSSRFSHMIMPVVLAVVGLYFHTMVYGYLRGCLSWRPANMLQLFDLGMIPPIAVLLSGSSAAGSIGLIGVGWIVVSLAVGGWAVFGMEVHGLSRGQLKQSIRELVTYGVPRVPAEVGLFGLFAIPTFIVANRSGIETAGFFSFSVSLLQLISAMFVVPGIVLLPNVSRWMADRRWNHIRHTVFRTSVYSLVLISLIVAGMEATLGFLIPFFMGQSFLPAVDQSRWILLGAVPYVLYMVLRSPLDALTGWPHNSINLTLALTMALSLMWFGSFYITEPVALLFALLLLGILTSISWRRSVRFIAAKSYCKVDDALLAQPHDA